MFTQIRTRYSRTPLPYLGILLFAVIISTILCYLEASNVREQQNFEESYQTIPVYVSVTNLSASQSDNLTVPLWLAEVFKYDSIMKPSLNRFVAELDYKLAHEGEIAFNQGELVSVMGLTSLRLPNHLRPDSGTVITWREGYDESIFEGSDRLCLIPENIPVQKEARTGREQIKVTFRYTDPLTMITYETKRTLNVAGTYTGEGRLPVYVPFEMMKGIYPQLHEDCTVQVVRFRLVDNDMLEELREHRPIWFAEPNPMGEKTEWGKNGIPYYLFAMDIDDTLLRNAEHTMETSIMVNKVSTVVVFGLSVCAGFLVGFLMVRSRKKEIALLRTLGTPNFSIYLGFMLEQMLCILVGTALGGLAFRWQPINQLGFFAAVYFIGLSLALMIFLSKNLMTSLKEEE